MRPALSAMALACIVCAHPQTSRTTLPNGVKVVISREERAEWLVVEAFVKTGVPAGNPAVRWVTAQAAYLSHRDLPQSALGQVAAATGGGLRLTIERDYLRYETITTPVWLDNALFLTTGAIRNSEFTEQNVGDAKKYVSDLLVGREAPGATCVRTLVGRTFGSSYENRPSLEQVAAVTPADCKRYYEERFLPSGVTLAIAGNIETQLVSGTVGRRLTGWQGNAAPPQSRAIAQTPFDKAIELAAYSAYVVSACVGPLPPEPDFPAFAVLSAVVGMGQTARLPKALREEGGAYEVGSSLMPTESGTLLVTYAQFQPAQFDPTRNRYDFTLGQTRDLAKETLSKLAREGPTQEEVERAKRVLVVDYMLNDPTSRPATVPFGQGHQRIRDRAFWLGWWEMSGAGYEMDAKFPNAVRFVTREAVAAAAAKYGANWGTVLTIPNVP